MRELTAKQMRERGLNRPSFAFGSGSVYRCIMEADRTDFETTALRRLNPKAKLDVMHGLIRQAIELKAAGLRALRPELSEEEVQALTRAHMRGDPA